MHQPQLLLLNIMKVSYSQFISKYNIQICFELLIFNSGEKYNFKINYSNVIYFSNAITQTHMTECVMRQTSNLD